MKRFPGAFPVLVLLVLACLDRQPALADCRSFFSEPGSNGLAVAEPDGRILAACNPDLPLLPASILKLATALVALQVLGPDYRFHSEFYQDREQNLYLRGFGDPMLVAEEAAQVLDRLVATGLTRINGIFIDNSSYALEGEVPGRGESDNPYDAPVSATAVNFNAVAVRVDADRRVSSAEAQTPSLPLMRVLAQGRPPGAYHLNICPGQCQAEERSGRLAAELFRALQRAKNIPGDGQLGLGAVPAGAVLLLDHRNSRPLSEVVASFLAYSNNFIANQVFWACGAARYGYPATWDKARRTAAEVLAGLLGEQTAAAVRMEEGSGLSRHNRVTARAMLEVLRAFAPQADLLRDEGGVRLKSGTMLGVHNYAGYLPNGRPFVILENQKANGRDRLLARLKREYGEER